MKRSASDAELWFDEEEPDAVGDAVEPTQGDRRIAVQPTLVAHMWGLIGDIQALVRRCDSGMQRRACEEQPNVEEGSILGAVVQPVQADLGLESQNFPEQPNVEERGGVGLQPTQVALPSPLIQLTDEEIRSAEEFVQCVLRDPDMDDEEVQGQRDVGEGSVQAASAATLQSMREGSGLESCSFLDVKLGTTRGNSGVAVQPTQAGLELESNSSQEQPNVEEVAIQADSGVAVPLTQAGSRLEFQNFQEQPNVEEGAIQPFCRVNAQPICRVDVQSMQADLGLEPQNLQEQPSVEERGAHAVQPTQVALPNPSSFEAISIEDLNAILHTRADEEEHEIYEEILQLVTGQGEASHQGEEAGIDDEIVPQDPPSDMNNLRNGQAETPHQEGESGMNDTIVPQAPPVGMDNLRNDGSIERAVLDEPVDDEEDIGIQGRAGQQQIQDGPLQQGTARRRMRLQVSSLCSATGPLQTYFAKMQLSPLQAQQCKRKVAQYGPYAQSVCELVQPNRVIQMGFSRPPKMFLGLLRWPRSLYAYFAASTD